MPNAKTGSKFVPVLALGSGARHVSVADALLRGIDGVENACPADLAGFLKTPGSIGVIVLVPEPGETLPPLLDTCRDADRGLPVVLVGDGLSASEGAAALRAGAADLVFLESEPEASLSRLRELIARRAARASGRLFEDRPGIPRMLGSSPAMREVARLVERVAPSDSTVLILGESGTGKELIAQAIHALSPRVKGPFVAINCAAIPETLLENELFGHEKGAYTGASSTAMGKVEAAERGTLFLDEIGEMPLPLQAKILRLLQERTYDRIGGTKTRKADVRIVAATNRELKAEAAAKRFREDLYYRLSVVPVPLPALRERPMDIPVIANAILEKLARDLARPGLRFSPEALARLVSYRWPGNVRELENELERAVVLAGRDEIAAADLELRSRVDDPDRAALSRLAPLDGPLTATLEAVCRTATRIRVAMALEETRGDKAAAAERLGLDPSEIDRDVSS